MKKLITLLILSLLTANVFAKNCVLSGYTMGDASRSSGESKSSATASPPSFYYACAMNKPLERNSMAVFTFNDGAYTKILSSTSSMTFKTPELDMLHEVDPYIGKVDVIRNSIKGNFPTGHYEYKCKLYYCQ